MPKIPANFLDGVFYLYPSVEAANAGTKAGGTGFFVCIPSNELPGAQYLYAVSNWHVAVSEGFSVIRVNTTDGRVDTIELGPEDWEFDAATGHDIAVAPLCLRVGHSLKYSASHVAGFVTQEKFQTNHENALGVGDEIFMVGRFVDHDGGPTNRPAARFGHISIGPSKIRSALGRYVDTICLDTNSRTGFSGSPVYVYRTMTSDLEELCKPHWHGQIAVYKHPMLMLLGVHTGQFPEWWDTKSTEPIGKGAEPFSRMQVRGLSGMTRVAPAWGIRQILDGPKLKGRRTRSELILASLKKSGAIGSMSSDEAAKAAEFGDLAGNTD